MYETMCIQLTHFSYDDCENTRTLLIIIIKSAVRRHCLALVHDTMIYAVCLSIFLWKMIQIISCSTNLQTEVTYLVYNV